MIFDFIDPHPDHDPDEPNCACDDCHEAAAWDMAEARGDLERDGYA